MTNQTFAEISLSPELLAAVTEMGFTATTDIQAEAIPIIRSGADVLARSQTGTGKTVAFGIPAVECVDSDEQGVQVLVLSPTRELAHQCGEEIRKLAKHLPYVRSADICGGSDYRDQFRNLREANLVIGTPGRIMDHMRRGTLNLSQLKMVILDEADEMLNMGFREDIEVILQDVPEQRQIVLFSATLPEEILAIAEQFQHEPVRIDVNHDQVTLDAIKQVFVDVPPKQKTEALLLLLHYYRPHRAIIFSNTKTMVDELAEKLSGAGFSVEGLHGDMKQLQRTTVMNGFRKGRVSILVATDVAARGIDVSDIDYVVNFDIPKESDSYVHRIGRTGRAGKTGTALTLCCGRMQMMQLRRLATRVKSEITQIDIPTVTDIENADQQRTIQSIEDAMQSDPMPFHTEMIRQLMDKGYAPERIAAVLLGMRGMGSTGKLKDLTGVVKKIAVREHRPMAGIVINIGSANRVTDRHIVGAITERVGMSSRDLGKIQIAESFSTVTVPAETVDDVILALRGCKICGKPVVAMPMPEQQNHFRAKPKAVVKPTSRSNGGFRHGASRQDWKGPKKGKSADHKK